MIQWNVEDGVMSESLINLQEAILVELGRSLRTVSLYGFSHPSTRDTIQFIYKQIEDFFKSGADLFEVAVQDGKILVSGKVSDNPNPVLKTFLNWFDRAGVISLSLHKGLTDDEVGVLLRVLSQVTQKNLSGSLSDGLKPLSECPHLAINTAVYTKIAKGTRLELVQGQATELSQVSGPVLDETLAASPTISSTVKNLYQQSKNLSGLKKVRFLSKLSETPEKLNELLAADLTDSEILESDSLFQSICDSYLHRVSRSDSSPTKLLKSFSGYKRLIEERMKGKPRENIQALVTKTYDDLRARIIATEFIQASQSRGNIAQVVKKWIESPDEMWRLLPQIRDILAEKGMERVTTDELVDIFSQKHPVKEVEISEHVKDILVNQINNPEIAEKTLGLIQDALSQYVHQEVQKSNRELKENNVRLVQEKQRMESIMENVSEGLVVTGPDGKVHFMNPAARNLLGMDASSMSDPNMLEKLMPGHVIAWTKKKSGTLAGGSWEVEITADASTKKTLRESMGVVRGQDGQISGSIFVLSDVTRQREIIEEKAEMFSKVAHEIRSSITTLKESMTILDSEIIHSLSDEQKKLMEIARRGIQRLNDSLVQVYQPVAAKKTDTVIKQWIEPEIILKKIMEGMASWLTSKEITVDFQLPEEEILLEADLDRFSDLLQAVIAYLIKKIMPKGRLKVHADIPLENPGELWVRMGSSEYESQDDLQAINMKNSVEILNIILHAVGVHLPGAVEALQSGLKLFVMDHHIVISHPLPQE